MHGEKKIEIKVESPICEVNLQESQISETKFSHQPVHEKEKPFKCNLCYNTFAQQVYLKRHMAAVHEEKKPFQCNLCDYRCSQKKDVHKHVAAVHDASFSENSNLKGHMASIDGGKK